MSYKNSDESNINWSKLPLDNAEKYDILVFRDKEN